MNAPTLLVLAVIGLLVFFAIKSIVKSHKKGACIGCSACSTGEGCSSENEKKMRQDMEKSIEDLKK